MEFEVRLRSRSMPVRLGGTIGTRLLGHREEVCQIAARQGLTNVRVFGSVGRGDETDDSDVDLLVDVAPGVGLLGLARCQQELETLLGAIVDLVPAPDLKQGVAGSVAVDVVPL